MSFRTWFLGLAVALSATGCGAAVHAFDHSHDVPKCSKWEHHAPTLDDLAKGCTDGGTIRFGAYTKCADGSTLWWTDLVRGTLGEVGHPHPKADGMDLPLSVEAACHPTGPMS